MLREIFTSLRLYNNQQSQSFRKHYATDRNIFKHICGTSRLLPYQYVRDYFASFTQEIELYDLSDTLLRTIVYGEISADMNIVSRADGTDVIFYDAGSALGIALDVGEYYMKVTDGTGNSYYSEAFRVIDFDEENPCFLKLTVGNSCDIGKIYHRDDSFVDILYLDMDLGKPVYKYQEEAEEAYDKTLSRTLQRSDKYYKLDFYAPEYIADFLSLLKLHDNIVLLTSDKGELQMLDINVVIEWTEESEYNAHIEIEFTVEKVVKTKCCDNIDVNTCLPENVEEVVALINSGDTMYTTPSFDIIPLEAGDRVLVDVGGGVLEIHEFQAGGTTVIVSADNVAGAIVRDANTGLFYYYETSATTYSVINSFNRIPIGIAVLAGGGNVTVTGHAFNGFNVVMEITCEGSGTWTETGATMTAETFNATGSTFPTGLDCAYRIKMFNYLCTLYSDIISFPA